ncbi:MAG TPA: hypothetical protein VF715_09215 [Thermoleophilaceae bacterium]|jgi:hypothetical protein
MKRGLLPVVLVLLAAAVAVPVRAAVDDDKPRVVAEAREFRDYRLFWLGERFRSHDLTYASREGRKGQSTFTFIYGDCEAESDSGCAPPYQIQNYHACARNLGDYGAGIHPMRRKPIRGAAVYEFGDGNNFDRIEVYTGRTMLAISAPTFAKARRVVRRLERINGELGPDDPLGPPARGAVRGKLRCP